MKALSRPSVQLFILALLVIGLGSVPDKKTAVDIHLHDTYYVVSLFTLAAAYTIILLTEAGLYAVTSWLRQWRWLQVFHIITLIVAPVLFMITPGQYEGMAGMPRRYFDGPSYSVFTSQPWPTVAVLIFLAGQIGFVVNIVAGFVRGKNPKNLQN